MISEPHSHKHTHTHTHTHTRGGATSHHWCRGWSDRVRHTGCPGSPAPLVLPLFLPLLLSSSSSATSSSPSSSLAPLCPSRVIDSWLSAPNLADLLFLLFLSPPLFCITPSSLLRLTLLSGVFLLCPFWGIPTTFTTLRSLASPLPLFSLGSLWFSPNPSSSSSRLLFLTFNIQLIIFFPDAAFSCTGLDPRMPQPHPLPLSSASSPSLYLPPLQLTDNPMNESDERSETLWEMGGEGEWERQHMYSPPPLSSSLSLSLCLSPSLSLSVYPHHHLPPPPPTSNLQNSVPVHPEEEQREKIKQHFFKKDSAWCCFCFFCMCLCSSMLHYLSFSHTLSLCHAHTNTHTHTHTHRLHLPTTATKANSFNQSSFISSLFPSSLYSFFSLSQQCRARLSCPVSIPPAPPVPLTPNTIHPPLHSSPLPLLSLFSLLSLLSSEL